MKGLPYCNRCRLVLGFVLFAVCVFEDKPFDSTVLTERARAEGAASVPSFLHYACCMAVSSFVQRGVSHLCHVCCVSRKFAL